MKKLLILLVSSILLNIACKDTQKGYLDVNPEILSKNNFSVIFPLGIDPAKMAQDQGHASALIDKRSKEENPYSLIVSNYWVIEFVFNGRAMSKTDDYAGYWLKFEDDFSFSYGIYDQILGGGRYHYTLDTGKMIMLNNDKAIQPQEWEIKAKENVIVMVGSAYFENNPRQIKVNRMPTQPQYIPEA